MVLFLGTLGIPELLVIAFIVTLLFGAKRIPEFFKGMGQGLFQFKRAIRYGDDAEKEARDAMEGVEDGRPDVGNPPSVMEDGGRR